MVRGAPIDPPTRGVGGQLCGQPLMGEERKQWRQAMALLVGLKIRKVSYDLQPVHLTVHHYERYGL